MKTGLKKHRMARACFVFCACMVAFVLAAFSHPAHAQSQYGCRALGSLLQPVVEGRHGVFFRTDPDLVMYNRLSQPVVDQIAQLSEELAAQGTALIVSMIPTKSLAMPEALSSNTIVYGYENRLSSRIYQDNLDRLAGANIAVVNAKNALIGYAPKLKAFFETDPRATNAGLNALATAIASKVYTHNVYGPAPKATFATTIGAPITLASEQHNALQDLCQDKLPLPMTRQMTTTKLPSDVTVPLIALITTDITGSPDLNYAGFLSEKTGFDVLHYSVVGNAMDSLVSYLISDEYEQRQPEFIVWNIPTWHNLANFSDQPMREAKAAASRNCTTKVNAALNENGDLTIDLSTLNVSADQTMLFVSDAPHQRVDFKFSNQSGMQRIRSVLRKDTQPQSRSFYMPLTGLWQDGASAVTISTHGQAPENPLAFLCGLNS